MHDDPTVAIALLLELDKRGAILGRTLAQARTDVLGD